MLYMSEINGKTYSTVEELEEAEALIEKENAEKEALRAQRKERADEVEKAFAEVAEAQKKANELLAAFTRDYGSYHKSYHRGDVIPDFFDMFFNRFF